jgi:AcrR family transcriptional regulator
MNELQDTRIALITAARALFAEHGYDGTSIKTITTRARANLGAVTYHFGTKEKLYHAVLCSVGEPFLARLKAAAGGSGRPLDRIEALVRAFFNHLSDNREMPSLMLHELSLSRPIPPPLQEIMGQVFKTVAGIIQIGQRDGSIIHGNPSLLVLSVLALPAYVMWMRIPLHDVAGVDTHDRSGGGRGRILKHIVISIRRSLESGAPARAKTSSGSGLSKRKAGKAK